MSISQRVEKGHHQERKSLLLLCASVTTATTASTVVCCKTRCTEHFTHLSDPRIDRTKNHLLLDIVAIAILAVIAGADGFYAIEIFGLSRQAWERAISSAYLTAFPVMIRNAFMFARLDLQQFQQCFPH